MKRWFYRLMVELTKVPRATDRSTVRGYERYRYWADKLKMKETV